jgi:class 3 adenylate cyclase
VARLCSAGHGGQILLSAAARDGLGRSRPAGLRMRDLGPHRFHGLRDAVAVVQVVGPELQARFPPLRTLAAADDAGPDANRG